MQGYGAEGSPGLVTMFILRALFWLTLMFLILAPRDFDLGGKARDAGETALAEGTKLVSATVAEQMMTGTISNIIAAAGTATETDSEAPPDADITDAPVPRPRLDRQ